MTPRTGALVIAGLIILALGGLYLTRDYAPAGGTANNANDQAIRTVVTEFGTRLKNVSLLAPDAGVQIAAQYQGLVADETIAAWQADPSKAPGRYTSSPWPDRINIVSVEQIGEGSVYRVEANIIEVTSQEMADAQKEVAAVQPITFTVENIGGQWLITEAERGAYSAIPQRKTLVGTWECLPKQGPGPHTMECAFGIESDGSHYAVNTMLMSTYPVDFPTGTRVQVEGVVVPAEQVSASTWQTYDIRGIIEATSITQIEQ